MHDALFRKAYSVIIECILIASLDRPCASPQAPGLISMHGRLLHLVFGSREGFGAAERTHVRPGLVQGKVSWIEGYGAFVDVALADGRSASGLIHKSELSWGVVSVPEAVVSVGAATPPCCGVAALPSQRTPQHVPLVSGSTAPLQHRLCR